MEPSLRVGAGDAQQTLAKSSRRAYIGEREQASATPFESAKQLVWRRVSPISGARARHLAEVEAHDAQEAIAKAFVKFELQPAHRERLIARPGDP